MTKKINLEKQVPDVLKKLYEAHMAIEAYSFDKTTGHLVRLLASRANGCEYCISMHTKEALENGETNERLSKLLSWSVEKVFTEKEKIAFAYTEALTNLDHKGSLATIMGKMQELYSEEEISILTSIIAMINLWNRIGISQH
jgi:AhpD family alkylhydroperoxidase